MSLPSALQAQVVADSIPDSEELEEVVVVGSRPVIKSTAEKTTYEAAEDPEAQTLTVLDMLKKVPGVTVDGQDNITLNGSSNFAVHVDGRPVPAFPRIRARC